MQKPAASGRPPVGRFVKGHVYCISFDAGQQEYLVGEFLKMTSHKTYCFTRIADNQQGHGSHRFYVSKESIHDAYDVHEVEHDEYPLFIGAKYLSRFYRRLLAGRPMRVRKVNKTPKSRSSRKKEEV